MKKTLVALTAAATAHILSACASNDVPRSPPLQTPPPIVQTAPQPTRHSVTDYISGASAGKLTQSQVPYSIDTIVLAGNREYVVQPNTHKNDGELEFRLTPYESATFMHDRTGRTVGIESPRTYVPTKVMIPAATSGDPATEASEISFKPIGAYASRAPPLKKRSPADIETRTRSNDDTEFNLNTTTIQGKEFYVAVKRDDKGNVTNTYFVPVEGSIVGIRQRDRAITLRNQSNIFEIAEVTDYKSREEKPVKSTAPEVESVK